MGTSSKRGLGEGSAGVPADDAHVLRHEVARLEFAAAFADDGVDGGGL